MTNGPLGPLSVKCPPGAGKPARAIRRPACELPEELSYAVRPVGVIRSPFQWREDAPRQATVGEPRRGQIVLRRTIDGSGAQNLLKDLAGFSHLIVLTWFHHSHGWRPQLVPPRDTVKRGLYATRAPDRPNPIGLSVVRLEAVYGVVIEVSGLDLLDGTPVLDLKPYIPAYDAFPEASAGWVDALQAPGPDHRPREGGPGLQRRSAQPSLISREDGDIVGP